MTASERRVTAIHEAGHATVMWSRAECDPVLKVTVVPRGKSLGAKWSVPDEERVHVTNEALEEQVAGLLGGRIAEEVNYGTLGAGALSDLERATETAYAMVAYYGKSKKIGPISKYDSSGTRDTFTKPFSEQTARDIDTEVRRIIEEAYAKARGIIERKSEQINRMADLLLEKETITGGEMVAILEGRDPATVEDAYASTRRSDSDFRPSVPSTIEAPARHISMTSEKIEMPPLGGEAPDEPAASDAENGKTAEAPAEETPAQDAPAGDGAETPDHE